MYLKKILLLFYGNLYMLNMKNESNIKKKGFIKC